jgi:CHASE2 domain-containing sensor protein/serine phosphatase RsbU (regulator of sigma subunit)
VALLAAALAGPETPPVRTLRRLAYDGYHAVRPRVRASAPAVIVAIDEPSLARHGQWPWPRTLLARLVTHLADAGAAAVGLDIVMPEPDRLSPARLPALLPDLGPELEARLGALPSHDARLGAALRGRPVVLGVAGLESPAAGGPAPGGRPAGPGAPVRVRGGDPARVVRRFAALLRSVPEIDAAAAGHGLLSVDVDGGVVRRMPLLAAVGPALVPAFAVELLRVGTGAPAVEVRAGPGGVEAVGVPGLLVPTEADGAVWLRFGPHDPERFVSAAEVLAGRVPPAVFAGRLALVGFTALGVSDYQATPVAERLAGVEIHAQLLEAIAEGALLRRPAWLPWAEAAVLALGGLGLVLAVPGRRPRAATAGGVLLMVAAPVAGLGLYAAAGLLADGLSPAVGLGLVLGAMLGVTLAEAESQRRLLRRELAREREAAARLAGELEAARRIQRGLLPDPARVLRDEPRVAVAAALEPAREVGGDLYDVFRVDDARVAFLVGDVAGKGLPGCLVMAVTRALHKAAALRRGGDLAAVLGEVNVEIARDNPEALFVTAWAGVLDARSGAVAGCGAGHDPPYLLARPGRALARLGEPAGPPLGVLEDFAYAATTWRLAPGDTLCLLTDGIVEARDPAGALYGRPRLEALLAGLPADLPLDAAVGAIVADVRDFAAGAEAADDLAVLLVRWVGPAAGDGGAPGASPGP